MAKNKKIWALLTMCLVFALMLTVGFVVAPKTNAGNTADVAKAIMLPSYVDEDGTTKTLTVNYTTVVDSASAVTWGTDGETTWYVVIGESVTIEGGVTVNGTVLFSWMVANSLLMQVRLVA